MILVLSTQRPSVDVVEGTIRTNSDTAICLRTRDSIQSRTVLDCDDTANQSATPGRAILQQNEQEIIQTFTSKKTMKRNRCYGVRSNAVAKRKSKKKGK